MDLINTVGSLSDTTVLGMGLAVVLLPLLAALALIFFGRRMPRGGDWLATGSVLACLAIALTIFHEAIVENGAAGWYWASSELGLSWRWISLSDFSLEAGILLDNVSVSMLAMVTICASCIFFFSQGYMHGDRDYPRFFAYLSYFCFAMLGLVVSDNLLFLFIFWELVGVGSYLLIGFWYDQEEPPYASLKAFMVNRVGDVLFMLGLILAWQLLGTLNFHEMFARLEAGEFRPIEFPLFEGWSTHALLTLSGCLIFCGAISKSAQVPLHTWLPDAMAGPTPVSALIHAATMVAAGVFMVGRMYPFFTPEALAFIAMIGAITALLGATMGLVMWDIKRVLAFSTMSQLGYMMLGLGVGGFTAGLFHLITHAFFKACLFLGSGSVIHAVHSQDIRDMGGLRAKMPWTYWTFLIATLALAGVPCFSGYFSKDQIVANALAWGMHGGVARWIPFVFAAAGAFMTTFYMLRLVFITFHGAPRDRERFEHAHESPAVMTMPLAVLATLAVVSAGTINPLADTDHLWFNELAPAPRSAAASGLGLDVVPPEAWNEEVHHVHYGALGTSILAILLGAWLARAMYLQRSIDPERVAASFGPMHRVVTNRYYFDDVYEKGVVRWLHGLNGVLRWIDTNVVDGLVNLVGLVTRLLAFVAGLFDRYVIDGLVNLWRFVTRLLASLFRVLQTGVVSDYAMQLALGALVIVLILWNL